MVVSVRFQKRFVDEMVDTIRRDAARGSPPEPPPPLAPRRPRLLRAGGRHVARPMPHLRKLL